MGTGPHAQAMRQDALTCKLEGGRAKYAAIWPRSLCLAILRGVRDQLKADGLIGINGLGVGTTCEDAVCEDVDVYEW